MSSRSKGVMKLELSSLNISCATPSPTCSRRSISLISSLRFTASLVFTISTKTLEMLSRLLEAFSRSGKKVLSCGTKNRRKFAIVYCLICLFKNIPERDAGHQVIITFCQPFCIFSAVAVPVVPNLGHDVHIFMRGVIKACGDEGFRDRGSPAE